MKKSEKKEIVQVYLNNEAILNSLQSDDSRRSTLVTNNDIIKCNFDLIEGSGAFDEYLVKCMKTMNGSSVEFIEFEEIIKEDIFDLGISVPIEDIRAEEDADRLSNKEY